MQYIQGRPLDDVLDELKQLVTNTDAPDSPVEVQQRNLSAETLIYEARSAMENPSVSNVSGSTSRNDTPLRSGSSIVLPSSESEDRSSGRQTYWHSVAQIGTQVADALSYAHGQGVLHRDIKPANLVCTFGETNYVQIWESKSGRKQGHRGNFFPDNHWMAMCDEPTGTLSAGSDAGDHSGGCVC